MGEWGDRSMGVLKDNFWKEVYAKESALEHLEYFGAGTALGVWPRHGGIGRARPPPLNSTAGTGAPDVRSAAAARTPTRPPSHHFCHPSDVSPASMNTIHPKLVPTRPLGEAFRPAKQRPDEQVTKHLGPAGLEGRHSRFEIPSADLARIRGHIKQAASARDGGKDSDHDTTHRAHFCRPDRPLRFAIPEAFVGGLRHQTHQEAQARGPSLAGSFTTTHRADFPAPAAPAR